MGSTQRGREKDRKAHVQDKVWRSRKGKRTGEKREERERAKGEDGQEPYTYPHATSPVSLRTDRNPVIKLNLEPRVFLILHGYCCLQSKAIFPPLILSSTSWTILTVSACSAMLPSLQRQIVLSQDTQFTCQSPMRGPTPQVSRPNPLQLHKFTPCHFAVFAFM